MSKILRVACLLGCLLLLAGSLKAQVVKGVLVNANTKGCKVFNPLPEPGDSVRWSGPCKENLAEGVGVLKWFSYGKLVATYQGAMKEGKTNGQGKYTFHFNGQVQQGWFLDGEWLRMPSVWAQRVKKNPIGLTDTAGIYQNDAGTPELNYLLLKPAGAKPKGLVALFPSFYEKMEMVLNAGDLPQKLAEKGFAVIVMPINMPVYLTESALQVANTVLEDALSKTGIPETKVVIGGFSLGGNHALRFAEISWDDATRVVLRPKGVFAIDPPCDLENLYIRSEREMIKGISDAGKSEARYLIDQMNKVLGGSPSKTKPRYLAESPYLVSEKDGGQARNLKKMPVLLFTEPDAAWYIENRRRDLREINATDCSSLINYLQMSGNDDARLNVSLDKGKRPDGSRHPHSWTIAEPKIVIDWLNKVFD